MKNIPKWVVKTMRIENFSCNECNKSLKEKDVIAVGVRNSHKDRKYESFFIEIMCSKCDEIIILELKDMSLVDLSLEILSEQSEIEIRREERGEMEESNVNKKRVKTKSKITQKEIKEVSKFLKSIDSHDDFLISLGMTPEEIDEYKFKPDNTDI